MTREPPYNADLPRAVAFPEHPLGRAPVRRDLKHLRDIAVPELDSPVRPLDHVIRPNEPRVAVRAPHLAHSHFHGIRRVRLGRRSVACRDEAAQHAGERSSGERPRAHGPVATRNSAKSRSCAQRRRRIASGLVVTASVPSGSSRPRTAHSPEPHWAAAKYRGPNTPQQKGGPAVLDNSYVQIARHAVLPDYLRRGCRKGRRANFGVEPPSPYDFLARALAMDEASCVVIHPHREACSSRTSLLAVVVPVTTDTLSMNGSRWS